MAIDMGGIGNVCDMTMLAKMSSYRRHFLMSIKDSLFFSRELLGVFKHAFLYQ